MGRAMLRQKENEKHGRITLRDHGDEGNDKDRARLEARIQHLDALHVKLDALIERAE